MIYNALIVKYLGAENYNQNATKTWIMYCIRMFIFRKLNYDENVTIDDGSYKFYRRRTKNTDIGLFPVIEGCTDEAKTISLQ